MQAAGYEFRLQPKWAKLLDRARETGAGYHLVDFTMRDGRVIENVPVLNAQYVCMPREIPGVSSKDVAELRVHAAEEKTDVGEADHSAARRGGPNSG